MTNTVFDADAERYERYRPHYCPGLFQEIFRYFGLLSNADTMEVGCGTGQATQPFLESGCRLLALEPGRNLAAVARRKYAEYNNFSLQCETFEDVAVQLESFNLIYSATAFHWIAPETGYPKLHSLLKPGGCAALFWNIPFPELENPVLAARFQSAYRRYRPDARPPESDRPSRYAVCRARFAEYGVQDISSHTFEMRRVLAADDYIGLLNTYSDHLSLPPRIKHPLEKALHEIIMKNNGLITVRNIQELYLARKSEKCRSPKHIIHID